MWKQDSPAAYVGEEVLILTDSDIWNKAVRRGYSSDMTILSLMYLLHLALARPPAIAHVKGSDNPADLPSRNQSTFELTCIPPHSQPARSPLALTKICGYVEALLLNMVRLPCPLQELVEQLKAGRQTHHIRGCACGT